MILLYHSSQQSRSYNHQERRAVMKRIIKRMTTVTLIAAMAFCVGIAPSSAASKAPSIEDIEYKGKGIVEVDFSTDVRYGKTKVIVKDNKGKKYKATILKKDEDDLKFKIRNYKDGRSYSFKITGVKAWGKSKARTVKGTVRIAAKPATAYVPAKPAPAKPAPKPPVVKPTPKQPTPAISADAAKNIALQHAGLSVYQVRGLKAELDWEYGTLVYEVEFERGNYEYDYDIDANTGAIVKYNIEYDD